MKQLIRLTGLLVATLLTACSADLLPDSAKPAESATTKVNITVAVPDYALGTRAAVKGAEGIDANALELLCFDSDGFYLGLGEEVTNEANTTGEAGRYQVSASVPNGTARIHFLANSGIDYQASWIGMHENTLMTVMVSNASKNSKVVYWGYVKKNSPEEMKTYLAAGSGNVVYLLRDRAKITVQADDDAAISNILLTVVNGEGVGAMAPFDRETLVFPEITADWQASAITLPTATETINGKEEDLADVAYTFEAHNSSDNPVKVILKVTYNDGIVRYHQVLLENGDHKPYLIKRNHEYRIVINKLEESLGYDSFEGAVSGTAANNPWIAVADIIPEISNGQYTMTIKEGTSIVVQSGSTATIHFSYSLNGSVGSDLTHSNFDVTWLKNEAVSPDAQPSMTYDAASGEGTIYFNLSTITDNLKEATIRLLDKKRGMSRRIKIYSIKQFGYTFDFPTTMSRDQTGTATLTFTMPDDYPAELLPVELHIASNDVNPKDCGVEVGSTADISGGEDWNCWFVYKAYTTGTHSIIMQNVRTNSEYTTGHFYIKTPYYNQGKPVEKAFNYTD
jgi:hypothetical protein